MSRLLPHRAPRMAPPPLFAVAATLLVGLSGRGSWESVPCPSLPSGLSLLGIDVTVVIESPLCGMSLHDLGTAIVHAGPLVWTISLATLLLGLASLLVTTGLGLALRGLLRRAREWFTARLLPSHQPQLPAGSTRRRTPLVRLADLRSIIGQRPPLRRGPPLGLLHG